MQVPGIYKLRYVGNATLGSAAVRPLHACMLLPRAQAPSWTRKLSAQVFGVFLAAGSLLHCGRSQGH